MSGYVPAFEIAKAWLGLGHPEVAIAWLERALEERSHSMVFLLVVTREAAFPASPRYRAG